jgi:Family of unknown function (DUF6134)
MTGRRVAGLCCALAVAAHAAEPSTRVYAFQALLDDKPIGTHRFTVESDGTGHRVTSDADFQVRFLGFEAYRYRHHAEERWSGDCLATLASDTDDDGKPARVELAKAGEANEITTRSGTTSVPGCLMTYAYWNPALRTQSRLLNPQTGQIDAVKVARVGSGRVRVHGRDVDATAWRISGGESPVDVWLSEQGEWIGLDSTVARGRHRLSYRLP